MVIGGLSYVVPSNRRRAYVVLATRSKSFGPSLSRRLTSKLGTRHVEVNLIARYGGDDGNIYKLHTTRDSPNFPR